MAQKKEHMPEEKYNLLSDEEKYRLTVERFTGDFSTMQLVYRPPTTGIESESKETEVDLP